MEGEPRGHEALTEEEVPVFRLMVQGRRAVEVAAELGIPIETAIERVITILMKLSEAHRPDPTPPPLAAAAALAVPYQRAEDIPRHVGRYVSLTGVRRSPTR